MRFFLSVVLISVFFLPSCGFLVGSGGVKLASNVPGAGEGETPTLARRLKSDPKLADEECSENDRCEETCDDIYDDSESQENCKELTIGQVSTREDVFYALLRAETEGLDDIEDDDFEDYVKIGLDGWKKVIERQKLSENRNERFENTLEWLVDASNRLIPILRVRDKDNEILRELALGHCNIDANTYRCRNENSRNYYDADANFPIGLCQIRLGNVASPPTPITDNCESMGGYYFCPESLGTNLHSVSHLNDVEVSIVVNDVDESNNRIFYGGNAVETFRTGIVFNYNDGGLYYCYSETDSNVASPNLCTVSDTSSCTTLYHKKLAEVEEEEDRDVLMALVGIRDAFFSRAFADRRFEAFSWGNDLLERVCADRSDTSVNQCIAAVYCWLSEDSENANELERFLGTSGVEERVGREIDLKNCNYRTDFSEI